MRTPISALTLGLCFAAFCGDAFAQSECEVDADCGDDMLCEVVGVSGCAGAPACAPDDPDCASEPVMCESEEFRACVAPPCETDSDCGEGMVCQVSEWEACGGSSMSCDENGDCEVVEGGCESGSSSECVYPSQLPCESDTDCGGNFTCVVGEEQCDCAASGGTSDDAARPPIGLAAPDAGVALPLPPEMDPGGDCSCSTYSYCQADEIECESDAECPSDWKCEQSVSSTCGGGMVGEAPPEEETLAPPPPDEAAFAALDGGAPDMDLLPPDEDRPLPDDPACEPVETKSMCVPPGGFGVGRPGGGGVPTSGGDEGGSAEPPVDDEGDPNVGEGVDVDDPAVGGDGSGEGDDEVPVEETDEEPADEDEGDEDVEDDEPSNEDNGSDAGANEPELNGQGGDDSGDSGDSGLCSMGTPGNSAAPLGWLVALFGLAMFRRRRA